MVKEKKYKLASGSQVREENFGLLFYTMNGPRLYFLSCGDLLDSRFFEGEHSLKEWLDRFPMKRASLEARIPEIERNLVQLKKKGVILEC